MSNELMYVKKIVLTNDEFFILMGLMVLNSNDISNFIKPFQDYNKKNNKYGITFTERAVDEILSVSANHEEQVGNTYKVIQKIKMLRELIDEDIQHDNNIDKIKKKYDGIINDFWNV